MDTVKVKGKTEDGNKNFNKIFQNNKFCNKIKVFFFCPRTFCSHFPTPPIHSLSCQTLVFFFSAFPTSKRKIESFSSRAFIKFYSNVKFGGLRDFDKFKFQISSNSGVLFFFADFFFFFFRSRYFLNSILSFFSFFSN